MPNLLETAAVALAALWLVGWALAVVMDITIARWPEAAEARRTAPPAPVRWLCLLLIWPVSLRAVLASQRRAR